MEITETTIKLEKIKCLAVQSDEVTDLLMMRKILTAKSEQEVKDILDGRY